MTVYDAAAQAVLEWLPTVLILLATVAVLIGAVRLGWRED